MTKKQKEQMLYEKYYKRSEQVNIHRVRMIDQVEELCSHPRLSANVANSLFDLEEDIEILMEGMWGVYARLEGE